MHLMKPGEDLIEKGMRDLAGNKETIESLLVSIGAPRLRRAGLCVPAGTFSSPEHRLYLKLAGIYGNGAHSKYNSLIRRLVSYERALECGL
jgi:hypothetical protein